MKNRSEKEQNIKQYFKIILKAIQIHAKQVENTYGLSSVRLWMLYEINNEPGIKVSVLASLLAIHKSTCSNMLDKLEKQVLIYRCRSKSDQRTVRLYITDQGKKILKKNPGPPEGKLSNTLNKLPSKQIGDLERSLECLVNTLQCDDEIPAPPILPK